MPPILVPTHQLNVNQTLVGRVHTSDNTLFIATTFPIPDDNTKPTWAEGFGYTQLDTIITPTSPNNNLRIEVHIQISQNLSSARMTFSLFRDPSGVDEAISAKQWSLTSHWSHNETMVFEVTAGSVSPTTFKLRLGTVSGETITVNGKPSNIPTLNGLLSSSMTVSEYTP